MAKTKKIDTETLESVEVEEKVLVKKEKIVHLQKDGQSGECVESQVKYWEADGWSRQK